MPKSILIADDSKHVRRAVRELLEYSGFTVCAEAADGVDTLEKVNRLSSDLLILDIVMPRLNGIEVIATLKDSVPHMPIVIFTLYDESLRLMPLPGVAAVISKSEGADALVACVKRLLAPQPSSSAPLEPSSIPA